jgi:hypothetical protein
MIRLALAMVLEVLGVLAAVVIACCVLFELVKK